jgi:hypothetical protein
MVIFKKCSHALETKIGKYSNFESHKDSTQHKNGRRQQGYVRRSQKALIKGD